MAMAGSPHWLTSHATAVPLLFPLRPPCAPPVAWELWHITVASPVLQQSDLYLELQDAPMHTHWSPSCHPPVNLAKVPAACQALCQVPRRGVIYHQGARSSARWDHLSALDLDC